MIYLIYGNQNLMVKNRLKKILAERLPSFDDLNYSCFSALDVPLDEIAYCCNELPLGVERKAVVVQNPFFLTGEKVKVNFDGENSDKKLLSFLAHPNDFCDLIFVSQSDQLSKTNAITKALFAAAKEGNAKIFELEDVRKDQWPDVVRRIARSLQIEISEEAIEELLHRIPDDAGHLQVEMEKMSLYTEKIDLSTVEQFVPRLLEDDVFQILQNLLQGKKGRALQIYRDLRLYNEEPVRLISLISGQLRVMHDIFYWISKGLRYPQVAMELHLNEYRVKKNLEHYRSISLSQIEEELERLYRLDFLIKSGQMDRFYGFEYYLLQFGKEEEFI